MRKPTAIVLFVFASALQIILAVTGWAELLPMLRQGLSDSWKAVLRHGIWDYAGYAFGLLSIAFFCLRIGGVVSSFDVVPDDSGKAETDKAKGGETGDVDAGTSQRKKGGRGSIRERYGLRQRLRSTGVRWAVAAAIIVFTTARWVLFAAGGARCASLLRGTSEAWWTVFLNRGYWAAGGIFFAMFLLILAVHIRVFLVHRKVKVQRKA